MFSRLSPLASRVRSSMIPLVVLTALASVAGAQTLTLPCGTTAPLEGTSTFPAPRISAAGPFHTLVLFIRFADDNRVLQPDPFSPTGLCGPDDWPADSLMPVQGSRFLHATTATPFDPLSLTQFFYEASSGQYTVYGDERGYVSTYPENHYFSGTGSSTDFNEALLIGEAMDTLRAQGVNFADYDADADGVLDHVFVSIRSFNDQIGHCVAWNGTACASGISGLYISTVDTLRFGILVDADLSGNLNVYQTVDPIGENVALFAHEMGHDIWRPGGGGGHLDPIIGNGIAAAGQPGSLADPDRLVGHGLMLSRGNSSGRINGQSVLVSAAERFHANAGASASPQWTTCTVPTSGQMYTMVDAETGDSCVRLPLGQVTSGPRQERYRNLFLSNVQRTSAFHQVLSQPVNRGSGPCNTCANNEWGLPTTGLMIELTTDASTTFNGYWSRDLVTADNRLSDFPADPLVCDVLVGVGLTNEQQYGGDFWRPDVDRQLTAWTRPNVYGYTFLSAVPTAARITGLHAIDDIRSGSGTNIEFYYHQNYNQLDVAYARENWWIGGEIANLAFKELRVQAGATLTVDSPSATTFSGNLVVEAGGTLDLKPGTRLQFAAGKGVIVHGTLLAAGATLNAVSPGAGWSGISVQSGGSAYLTAGTIVERVGTPTMYGSGAVRVFGGALIVDASRIENPAGLGSLFGVYASGPSSNVLIKNLSFVLDYPLGGLYAASSAFVQAWGSTVSSGGQGLQASSATIWSSDLTVTNNGAWGAISGNNGFISFSSPLSGQPTVTGQNTEMNANVTGDLYASNGTYTGGSSISYRRNSFTSAGTQASLNGESSAVLEANWWGQTTGPDLARVTVGSKSSFDYCPWVTAPAGPLTTERCIAAEDTRSASAPDGVASFGQGEEEEVDPLDPALTALDVADAADVFDEVTAVLDSLDATSPDSVLVLRSVPIVVAALRFESLPEGHALLDRLTATGAGVRTASGNYGSALAARTLALAAFGRSYEEGRAAAQALTADARTAPSGYGLLALAAIADDNTDAALTAMEAAEQALTPHHAPDDVEFVGSVRADLAAATGARGAGPAAPGSSQDMPAEVSVGQLATLSLARPNPTGGATVLTLSLAGPATLNAAVFDGLGRRVVVLATGTRPTGTHELRFEAGAWPSGVYVVRAVVSADGQTETLTRRVVVTR